MSVDFSARPWQLMPEVFTRFPHVPTMLSGEELKLLYWLARDWYRGEGAVVDAGAFLGGSTSALCAGLEDNGAVPKVPAVHVFDQFLYDPYFATWFAALGEDLKEGDSFTHVYRRMTAQYERFIEPHVGDVTTATWPHGPIEILFLDICKSWEINAHVVRTFFPALVPGRSIIVQQDFLHFWAFWLVLTMDHFADHFEYVGRVTDSHSAVFLCTRPISEQEAAVDLRAMPLTRKQEAFERAVRREHRWQRTELLVAYARCMLDAGEYEVARAVAARLDVSALDNPINRVGLTWLPAEFWPVRGGERRDGAG